MELENKVPEQINDIKKENFEKLAQLFPSIIKDGQVDFKALKEELGEFEEVKEERYEFTWAGKQNAKKKVQEDVGARTLKYIEEDSKNPNTTENLYIEGDNLEVLKLLRQNYYGSIKMIYIDPPYNTGKDFIYKDNFSQDGVESDIQEGSRDEEGNRLEINNKSSNRYHANWLNMIYPRLKVARDLLTDNGVIFISIDDNEQENLKKICDEIFGEVNHLETFKIQVRYANKSLNEDNDFQPVIEYVLIYAKNRKIFVPQKLGEPYDLSKFCFSITEKTKGETIKIGNKIVTIFKKGEWEINRNEVGRIGLLKETWASGSLVNQSGTAAEFLAKYLIERKSIDGLNALYKIYNMGEDGLGYRYVTGPQKLDAIRGKFYSGVPTERIKEIEKGISLKFKPIVNYYDYCGEFGNIRLEGQIAFNSGKKPIKMLKNLLYISNVKKNDIILDFFSGSATTAHAVMQLNAEDGGNRKYIMVQISEEVDEKSEAYKFLKENNKPTNICEIGKERIRRAGELIKKEIEESNKQLQLGEEPKKVPDIGFKVFRTADTNINWKKIKEVSKDNVMKFDDPDMLDFTLGFNDKDVVYEVLLRQRDLPLSEKLVTLTDIGSRTYLYADSYLVCLETNVTEELIEKLAELNPLPIKFIFRDSAFGSKIGLKEETFRKLKTLVEKNSGLTKKAYTVEFI